MLGAAFAGTAKKHCYVQCGPVTHVETLNQKPKSKTLN